MAWALRRVQERRRRAKPDPRGLFSASRHPAAKVLRGSSIARRGVGLGTATSPGPRASGGARPTGGAFRVEASSGEDFRGSSNSSTRRWLGHCGESRNAGVGSRLLDGHALREVPRLVPPAASLNFASLHEPKLACAASRARTRSLHCDRLRKIARLVVSTHAPRAHEFRPKHLTRPSTPSFDGHALCQVTRFIHIRPPGHCRVIRQQLQRHHVQDRGQFAVVFR